MKKIKINCNKKQYKRLIEALSRGGLDRTGRCFLGKTFRTCQALTADPFLTCEKCLNKHIERIKNEDDDV